MPWPPRPAGQAVLAHGGPRPDRRHRRGRVHQAAAAIRSRAARHALISAYQVGFTSTFNHLMAIAAVVCHVGAVGSLVLVRQRDFVPSYCARGR